MANVTAPRAHTTPPPHPASAGRSTASTSPPGYVTIPVFELVDRAANHGVLYGNEVTCVPKILIPPVPWANMENNALTR